MVDAPNPTVKAIWVEVESVTAHVAGLGWMKLSGDKPLPLHVDLLTLTGGQTAADLGFLTLPAGTVTQIRLLIGRDVTSGVGPDLLNYVVLDDGADRRSPSSSRADSSPA